MSKRRVAALHAAGGRIVSGSDGGINAAKSHGLLPLSIASLVDGGLETFPRSRPPHRWPPRRAA